MFDILQRVVTMLLYDNYPPFNLKSFQYTFSSETFDTASVLCARYIGSIFKNAGIKDIKDSTDLQLMRAKALDFQNEFPLLINMMDAYARFRADENRTLWQRSSMTPSSMPKACMLSPSEWFDTKCGFSDFISKQNYYSYQCVSNALNSISKRILPKFNFNHIIDNTIFDSYDIFTRYLCATNKFIYYMSHSDIDWHSVVPFQIDLWIIPRLTKSGIHRSHTISDDFFSDITFDFFKDDEDDIDEKQSLDDLSAGKIQSLTAGSIYGNKGNIWNLQDNLTAADYVEGEDYWCYEAKNDKHVDKHNVHMLRKNIAALWSKKCDKKQNMRYKRYILVIDRRNPEHIKAEKMVDDTHKYQTWNDKMYLIAPKRYNEISKLYARVMNETFITNTMNYLFPMPALKRNEYSNDFIGLQSGNGYKFVVSFHVYFSNKVKMYLYFGQGCMRFFMDDIDWLLPRYFNPRDNNNTVNSFQQLSIDSKYALQDACVKNVLEDKQFDQFAEQIAIFHHTNGDETTFQLIRHTPNPANTPPNPARDIIVDDPLYEPTHTESYAVASLCLTEIISNVQLYVDIDAVADAPSDHSDAEDDDIVSPSKPTLGGPVMDTPTYDKDDTKDTDTQSVNLLNYMGALTSDLNPSAATFHVRAKFASNSAIFHHTNSDETTFVSNSAITRKTNDVESRRDCIQQRDDSCNSLTNDKNKIMAVQMNENNIMYCLGKDKPNSCDSTKSNHQNQTNNNGSTDKCNKNGAGGNADNQQNGTGAGAGGVGGGGNGNEDKNGKDDKDDKKKRKNNIKNNNNKKKEKKEKKEEKENEEEEKSAKWNPNAYAVSFVPKTKLNTLSTINEEENTENSSSQPLIHKPQKVTQRKLSLHQVKVIEAKAANSDDAEHKLGTQQPGIIKCVATSYTFTAGVTITPYLVNKIIFSTIKEKFLTDDHLWEYMNITWVMQFSDNHHENMPMQTIKIINYNFHTTNNEIVYCVAEKASTNSKWKMKEKLFTAEDIKNEYPDANLNLPMPSRMQQHFKIRLDHKFNITQLMGTTYERGNLINTTNWSKINVYSKTANKRRVTLQITKLQFIADLKKYVFEPADLIPIILFYEFGYRVEFLWIVAVSGNNLTANIGISLIYSKFREKVEVTGIHIDKSDLIKQCKWISLSHETPECLRTFTSNIDQLSIGNPDESYNHIKDLRRRNNDLKQKNKELINVIKKYETLTSISLPGHQTKILVEIKKLTATVLNQFK